ncbi:MAG: hypothetical protein ACYTGH_06910 [Planctomycetota bacterium]
MLSPNGNQTGVEIAATTRELGGKEVSSLTVRDSAGNATNISPHVFELTEASEPMAWSYYSENEELGQKVNVDMMKVVRSVEKLTGEKLVHIGGLKGAEANPVETGREGKIAALEAKLEAQDALIRELLKEVKALKRSKN